MTQLTVVVVGGGAAGYFAAITCAQANPDARVILLEKTRQPLAKVRISGGGRCNVTHACFDPAQLVTHYPRGSKELRGPFSRFSPQDTIAWFAKQGVELKTESDGRMFPITDSSETIIHCLMSAVKANKVQLRTEAGVTKIERGQQGFILSLADETTLACDRLLLATGSHHKTYEWLAAMGHTINPLVPSLFTFNTPTSPLKDLSGVSVPKVELEILETSLHQKGPLLITHWGFSGPAVLKLSAWGARILHRMDYKATLQINWQPDYSEKALRQKILDYKKANPSKSVSTESPCDLPRNLWKALVGMSLIPPEQKWAVVSKPQVENLLKILRQNSYQIEGKSTNKDEFVTCGGVHLAEVNFKTMESRLIPNLYFAGEILDIDGVTGGFNFQNAWTTGWLAGNSMAEAAIP